MKFKKSVLIALSLTGVALPLSISLPIVLTTTVNNKVIDNDYYYLYNGQYYDSIDNATDDAIINKKAISSDIYVGNITDSIFDQEFKRLDINKLRAYDRDKLYPAFKNSLGQYEPNYEAAKKSFVNNGLIQYLYDDFRGNIFNSENEALNSMRNAVFKTPLAYHTLSLANETDPQFNFNFNPLNPQDVNDFKYKVLDNLHNHNNGLDIKAYDLITNKEVNIDSPTAYSSANLEYLNDANYYVNFANEISDLYLNTKYDFMNGNDPQTDKPFMTWDVDVAVDGVKDGDYYFFTDINKSFSNSGVSLEWSGSKPRSVRFKNVKTQQLRVFDSFLNRDALTSHFIVEGDKANTGNWVYESAKPFPGANGEYFLGWNFILRNDAKNGGGWGGIDIMLLKPGSGQHEGAFNVTPFMSENVHFLQSKFEQMLYSRLQSYIDSKFSYNAKDSFTYKLNQQYSKYVYDVIWQHEKSFFDNNRYGTKNKIHTGDWSFTKETSDIYSDITFINTNVSGEIWESINWKDERIKATIELKWKTNGNGTFMEEFKKLTELNSTSKTMKYIIEYNNNPLFEIPWDIYMKYLNKGDYQGLFPINKNNILKNIKENDKKLVVDSFINISNSFKTFFNQNNSLNHYLPYEKNNKSYTYGSITQDEKGLFDHSDLEYEPSIENKSLDYRLNTALWAYNKSLKNIYANNDDKLPEFSKSYTINPDEVITLYEKPVSTDNQLYSNTLEFYYSEYLGISSTFNTNLIAQNSTTLFNDEDKINEVIRNNNLLKPAKVVVLYDLLGNVINPGVKLSEDEKLSTTNDAVYDSQSSIIDNLLRTKIIRNDPTKVFHYDNEKYTLLDNIKDIVYTLNWENRNYHFPTFKDARNYAYEFIKTQVIRVPR